MNFQQLRFVREVVRQNFNLTEAARKLFTSQPGVSKGIIDLESELGITIFQRDAKRIRGLTVVGQQILQEIDGLLQGVDRIKGIAQTDIEPIGQLTIATTHTQARYKLPAVIQKFSQMFPKVRLSIIQGDPQQIAKWLTDETADVGIATESLADNIRLTTFPSYQWQHCLIAKPDAPIWQESLTLERIAREPLVTYCDGFAGRSRIDQVFLQANIHPNIVLQAIDADVIKTYVEIGLGVGLIAEVAVDSTRDQGLIAMPVGHFFGINTTRLAIRKGTYLRQHVKVFLRLFAPSLETIDLDGRME